MMNSDLDEGLRRNLAELAADVSPPGDLAERARKQSQRRRRYTVVGGTAGMLGIGALAIPVMIATGTGKVHQLPPGVASAPSSGRFAPTTMDTQRATFATKLLGSEFRLQQVSHIVVSDGTSATAGGTDATYSDGYGRLHITWNSFVAGSVPLPTQARQYQLIRGADGSLTGMESSATERVVMQEFPPNGEKTLPLTASQLRTDVAQLLAGTGQLK